MRKSCKECPYKVDNNHNRKHLINVKKMSDVGIINNNEHTCHMITPGWEKPTSDNICIGSIKNQCGSNL